MHNRIFAFAIIFVAVGACKNEDKKKQPSVSVADTATAVQPSRFSDPYFYKTLEGTIAGNAVVMHFLKEGNEASANYFYINHGQPIFLTKDWDKENMTDSIYLVERTEDRSQELPHIALRINADGIQGIWKGVDQKTHTISLKESERPSLLHFNAYNYTDSAFYLKLKTKDTPTLKSSITMVMAQDQNEEGKWLNDKVKTLLYTDNNKYTSLQLPEMIKALVKEDLDGYEADADSSMVGVSKSDNGSYFFLDREYSTTSNIIYNNNGYTVMSLYSYGYTGGAHGYFQTKMYCFDVSAKKQLALQDIVAIDSLKLRELLEKNYRKQYQLSGSTPLETRLFVKNISSNNNFYFGSSGLGFFYAPYEIAGYAAGEINIWIPFSELKPYLNPSFAKRMSL